MPSGARSSFPPVPRERCQLPLRSAAWTIWPDVEQTSWEWALGHPLELSPFTWDYVVVSCDGLRLELQPHYDKSTWDTFWIDTAGSVEVQAFRGLLRETLGVQHCLRAGIVSTVGVLAHVVERQSARDALLAIRDQLAAIAPPADGAPCDESTLDVEGLAPPPGSEPLPQVARRRGMVARFWRWKLGGGKPPPQGVRR